MNFDFIIFVKRMLMVNTNISIIIDNLFTNLIEGVRDTPNNCLLIERQIGGSYSHNTFLDKLYQITLARKRYEPCDEKTCFLHMQKQRR